MNEDDSARLDVGDHQAMIDELTRKLDVAGTISSSSTASIYRIPACIRETNPAVYEPLVLSLGPYHHRKPQCQAMDELKWCYFKSFLRRNLNKNVKDYFKLVDDEGNDARGAYSEQGPSVVSKNFVEMMMLDCCFVLEFLLINNANWNQGGGREEGEIMNPIHKSAWALPFVLRDMLLLENQLPFFLLESLLKLNIPDRTPSFTQIVLDMFCDVMPGKIQKQLTGREGATVIHIHHILHLIYSRIIPMVQEDHPETVDGVASQEQAVQMPVLDVQTPMPKDHPNSCWSCWFKMFQHGPGQCSCPSGDPIDDDGDPIDDDASQGPTVRWIPCANKLREAGVLFKWKTNYKSFLEVTFDIGTGTMEIPPLQIFGHVSSIFNNLITFEQCYTPDRGGSSLYLSNYASLMSLVINTTADVELLEQEGIIVSTLGRDKDVAILFNQLGKNTAIDNNIHMASVLEGIQNHCGKKIIKYKAILQHKYFDNPWTFISVLQAIVLLILALTQTGIDLMGRTHAG